MSKRKYRMNDRVDLDVLEATSEQFRIQVDTAFQTFVSDAAQLEYSFPPNLSNLERKHIHQKAIAYNLISRSHGKDPNRTLTIYKKHNKSNFESFFIDLSPQSRGHLANLQRGLKHNSLDKNFVKLNSNDKVFGRFALGPPPPVVQPNISPHIEAFQKQLPIYEMKMRVLETIRLNQVVIISSETGSGKTTQIPQYIMDDCRLKGENCRVLCTQPRRISAVSVAERVAEERGSIVGDTVGYQVRLETKLGPHSNLIYCTNGVLIRNLMLGDSVLSSLTHIIIDEVHERDKLSDFLLICLRESLRKGSHIKLILMSATINIDKFLSYFDNAAILKIPGRLFCIKEVFLDEILDITGYDKVIKDKVNFCSTSAASEVCTNGTTYQQNDFFDEILMFCNNTNGFDNEQAWCQLLQYMLSDNMPVNYQNSQNGMTALMVAINQENVNMVEKLCTLGSDASIKDKLENSAMDLAERKGNDEILLLLNMLTQTNLPQQQKDLLTHYYKTVPDDDIDYDLITKLICIIHDDYLPGAILVFLPGYDDIMICNDRIIESNMDRNTYRVFFLHGSMNIKEQHEVFKPSLPHRRKIILSTNIAETSLTIDDVVYVIDCGKAKVLTYDSCSGLSSLQTHWISKACVKQRAGRAGRTNAGMAFHLFSQLRYDSFLVERIPEILRVPLEELCLNTKTLARNFPIYEFLVKAPDPPSPNTVKTAIDNLECLGALDNEENLTPLGEYLSQLTIEPHLGKMLIYSAIFRCLDPVLTIVASLAQKDPFQLPPQANLRTAAGERRKNFAEGTFSDHFIYLKAFMKWQMAVQYRKERQFCREYFISPSTMETILKTRVQLLRQLKETKFVNHQVNGMSEMNIYAENWPLVKAIISAGLYPKLSFKKGNHFCTRTEKKVLVHNSSTLSKETVPLWLVYDELVKVRNGSQIRGVTPITPITISLMCGIKITSPLENHMDIDDWLEFEFPNTEIINLRKLVNNIIFKKLSCPTNSYNDNDTLVMNTLTNVLTAEELSLNMPLPQNVKQRPKFFLLNRTYENNKDPVQEILDDTFFTMHDQNEKSTNYIGSSLLRTINNQSCNVNETGGAIKKQFPPAKKTFKPHFNNAQRNGFNNGNFYGHNGCGDVAGTSTGYYSRDFNYGNFNGFRCGHKGQFSGAKTEWSQMDTFNLDKSIFFVIKAKKESNILIAYENCCWVFAASTEKKLVAKDNEGFDVFLLYMVPEMNCFYGVAKFLSLDRNKGRPTGKIEWVFQNAVPFKDLKHLRNPLNDNRLIYDTGDGFEVEKNVAKQLWDLFSERKNNMGRSIKNFNHYRHH